MKYYKRVDAQGKTTTVESYSHNSPVAGAVEIDQAEYDAFIASLPPAPPPPDWPALYAAASTDSNRLKIVAQKLGLVASIETAK